MKTQIAIAIAASGLIASSAYATLTTSTGTSATAFQNALTGFNSTEAVLNVAAGDGLLNEQTKKVTRRIKTPTGWENQVSYQSYVTESPYELAFLNPQNTAEVETEGQFAWQSSWANNQTGLVDFSVELSGTVLKADLGGMELEYDTAPTGRIDAVGLWISGGAGEYMSFNGFLNGNEIAASNIDSPAKWYLFELDDALQLLSGQLKIGSSSAGYPWNSLSMMVKFFSSPIPVPTPEPSTIAFIGVGALAAISMLRRRKKALVAQ